MTNPAEHGRSDFAGALLDSWLPGAMLPSELLWLGAILREAGVEVVIECGRQDAVSTWALATMLRDSGVEILSIDFDDDPAQLARAKARLDGLAATCVSGDIHVEVPRLLSANRGRSVAVVQDGPKGWEGMATLLAAAFQPNVALVAQHNLHAGHVTRTVFQMISLRPSFLEHAGSAAELVALRQREVVELPARQPNRPLDHTSLGVIELDEPARAHLTAAVHLLRSRMAPWDPVRVAEHWDKGDFTYCTRLRRRARFTPARFKKR